MNKVNNDKYFISYIKESYNLKDTSTNKEGITDTNKTKESVKEMLDKEFEKKNERYLCTR
ncbi:MAG: hypothetical protein N3I35_04785 [Clostridia bacterium]|nr:hypothetical protein [Clostridia bacterium]